MPMTPKKPNNQPAIELALGDIVVLLCRPNDSMMIYPIQFLKNKLWGLRGMN